ncbi:ankyrin repeat containing protein [Coccidioides posadasii C735 delta SOWgp]|uniref:Ankyrin repeat containing protein n=1 Tax=Coccidioides posadasii (strain C735) TaxID=222929 RepID=C5P6K7_COCP7|nr:ankyrin repeat containing protein [Coccidioides posadasii C735 delta SOWgp]EER27057.1 ankyrin repeat containing protein [Coccidioides posadasii C735 delta SOWgp]|eukprot:XP_003069202.1 ankyrin repeat containing protein [Coccidioides posadasii C735 delta SOWgp]
MVPPATLSRGDYTVGWICALPLELAAAQAILDTIHEEPLLDPDSNDDNGYVFGSVGDHNVVIACLPSGVYGTVSAARVAKQMTTSYKSIRFNLMVGIGGGVPSTKEDTRLGDVVVSKPTATSGGVIQYDLGKRTGPDQLKITGTLNKPPQVLLTAAAKLEARDILGQSQFSRYLSQIIERDKNGAFAYPGADQDILFSADYDHVGEESTCSHCDQGKVRHRAARKTEAPKVHYGLIASGNQVMRHGLTRDRLALKNGILCFEMEAAGLMDDHPCLVIRGICDYADSHKNKQWQGYAAAVAAAYGKEILISIPAKPLQGPSVVRVRQSEILNALLLTQPEDDRNSLIIRKGKRVENTCQWIMKNQQYRQWLEQTNSQILWLSGGPGKGKTILAIYLTEELERCVNLKTGTVLYYFCDNQDEKRNTALAVLRGLLHQLLEQHPYLAQYIEKFFDGVETTSYTVSRFERLWRAFYTLLQNGGLNEVVCVVDGLDECEDESLKLFLDSLHSLFLGSKPLNTRFKLLLLSRAQPTFIESKLGRFPRLDLDVDCRHELRRDVEKYITAKVNELELEDQLEESRLKIVREALEKGADGTFLWVGFVADELKGKSKHKMEEILTKVPKRLGDIYKRILHQMEDKEQLARILQWVVLARRPLTLTELAIAVDIHDSNTQSCVEILKDQLSSCRQLLKVVGDSVSLIHNSAKDFLLGDVHSGIEAFCVREETHLVLARTCLDTIEVGYKTSNNIRSEPAESTLFPYASRYWLDHLRQVPDTIEQDLFSREFFTPNSSARGRWWADYWVKEQYGVAPTSFTLLHLAAYFGVTAWAKVLLKKKRGEAVFRRGPEHMKDSYGRTPLFWAASRGHREVARLLLDNGANVNAKDKNKLTPLHVATTSEHTKLMALLLDRGAHIEAKEASGDTPLARAIENGSKEVIKVLLERGANEEYLHAQTRVRPGAHAATRQVSIEDRAEALLDLQDDLLFRRFEKRFEVMGFVLGKVLFLLRLKPFFKLIAKYMDYQLDQREASSFEVLRQLVVKDRSTGLEKAVRPVIKFCDRVVDSKDIQRLQGLVVVGNKLVQNALAPGSEALLGVAIQVGVAMFQRAVNQQFREGLDIIGYHSAQSLKIAFEKDKHDVIRREVNKCMLKWSTDVTNGGEESVDMLGAAWSLYKSIVFDGDPITTKEVLNIYADVFGELVRSKYSESLFSDLTIVLSNDAAYLARRRDHDAVQTVTKCLMLLAERGDDVFLDFLVDLVPASFQQILHRLPSNLCAWLIGEGELLAQDCFLQPQLQTRALKALIECLILMKQTYPTELGEALRYVKKIFKTVKQERILDEKDINQILYYIFGISNGDAASDCGSG